MQILQNIKFQYHIKEINDLVSGNKHRELSENLISLYSKDAKMFFKIIKHFYRQLIEIRSTENIFINNLVLVNSFMSDDQKIVSNFFDFYFTKVNFKKFLIDNFSTKIAEVSQSIDFSSKLSVDDMINNSIIFQMMMSFKNMEKILFLHNDFVFFSTEQKLNFCHSGQVKCFFHIVDHPYQVYSRLKKINNGDKNISQNIMFNLDNSTHVVSHNDVSIEIMKKGWTVHSNSWCDPNVINSMRGIFIKKEDFKLNPEETYANLILHLRQSGEEIPLDYKLIDQYIEDQPYNDTSDEIEELSNNEKKFIQRNCTDLNEDLIFDF